MRPFSFVARARDRCFVGFIRLGAAAGTAQHIGPRHMVGLIVLQCRFQLRSLQPGTRLVVASRDAGAPIEVPAWCRLTGHTLHDARPPFYLIQKRNHET